MTILRYVFLGLTVLIVACVGWRSMGGMRLRLATGIEAPSKPKAASVRAIEIMPARPPTPEQTRAEVVRHLDDVPQYSAFYQALSTAFPSVYGSIIDRAAKQLTQDGTLPSSGALIWDALRDLQQSHGILAARADGDALTKFFAARLSMLDVLASVDQRTCADFLYGDTDPAMEDLSRTHSELVADMAASALAVIEDGQREHLDPTRPSSADLDLVANGLTARQLNPDEIAMLLDGKTIDPPLPDARVCEIGRIYLTVLRDLPPDVRQRVYGFTAELLARS